MEESRGKMKFNVIIPFRGRLDYLRLCLKSLDIAAKGKDVVIKIVSDEDFTFKDDEYYDVPITFGKILNTPEQFNKAILLNAGLKYMRQDYDFVSIVDADMIYNPNFFDTISRNDENTYFISGGYKLTEGSSKCILDDMDFFIHSSSVPNSFIDQELTQENDNGLYPSQITLSKYLYETMLDILGTKNLYNEGFIGWGGEDSYLSFFSRHLERKGVLKRVYDPNMWYHLWHPPARESKDFNEVQFKKNVELLHEADEQNKEKINEYIRVS